MIFEVDHFWLFLMILPIIAFLYSSVGHGGASGYLALMALFSFAPETMKPTALLLNLFVAGISFYYYYREGYFNKRLFLSFAISSIGQHKSSVSVIADHSLVLSLSISTIGSA